MNIFWQNGVPSLQFLWHVMVTKKLVCVFSFVTHLHISVYDPGAHRDPCRAWEADFRRSRLQCGGPKEREPWRARHFHPGNSTRKRGSQVCNNPHAIIQRAMRTTRLQDWWNSYHNKVDIPESFIPLIWQKNELLSYKLCVNWRKEATRLTWSYADLGSEAIWQHNDSPCFFLH